MTTNPHDATVKVCYVSCEHKTWKADCQEIRTRLDEKGNPWFVGSDIAKELGYSDPPKSLKMHVDSEDKLTRQIVVSGQRRKVIIINESGLYALILSSKQPYTRRRAFKLQLCCALRGRNAKSGGKICRYRKKMCIFACKITKTLS